LVALFRTYPTELKVKAIRRYEKGEFIKALSEEVHISRSTLYQWCKGYCSMETPNRTYTSKEFNAICRRLPKMEHEMEVVRLLDICPTSRSKRNR